jgi:hypothetical protein
MRSDWRATLLARADTTRAHDGGDCGCTSARHPYLRAPRSVVPAGSICGPRRAAGSTLRIRFVRSAKRRCTADPTLPQKRAVHRRAGTNGLTLSLTNLTRRGLGPGGFLRADRKREAPRSSLRRVPPPNFWIRLWQCAVRNTGRKGFSASSVRRARFCVSDLAKSLSSQDLKRAERSVPRNLRATGSAGGGIGSISAYFRPIPSFFDNSDQSSSTRRPQRHCRPPAIYVDLPGGVWL